MRTLVFLLLTFALASAEDSPLVSEVFSTGDNVPSDVEALIKPMLSPRGQTVLITISRKIMVQDDATHLAEIRALMDSLNAPVPNVRIDITVNESGSTRERGVNGHGNFQNQDGHIEINAIDRGGSGGSMNSQFLLVRSGSDGFFEVGQDVPFVDYFYTYSRGLQLVAPETHWQSIGSRLRIHPLVRGNLIDVEVIPEITSLVDGREQIVSYRNLSTVVTVANGASIPIGGFTSANDDFNHHFFTRRNQSQIRSGATITLKATIQ